MKYIKEYNAPSVAGRRGWNNYRSEDGRFFIRQSGGRGARWIIKTTDGTTPFRGFKGKPTDVKLADTIDEAKFFIERAIETEEAKACRT